MTRGQHGAVALACGLFVAGITAGVIHAGPSPTPPTATGDTTTEATTATDSVATTTTPVVTTTATVPTTTAVPAATALEPGQSVGSGGCVLVAALVLQEPGVQARVLGPAAFSPRVSRAGAGGVAYPASGSILSASSIGMHAANCANGSVELHSVSLFRGAVTAGLIELIVRGGVVAKGVRIDGLAVFGKPAAIQPGRALSLGSWGYAIALPRQDGGGAGALTVHLNRAHAGLPAGAVLLVSFARLPPRKVEPAKAARVAHRAQPRMRAKPEKKKTKHQRRRHRKRLGDDPLRVTPPLGVGHYMFPVAGDSNYVDTYGGFRGDVPGNWHHGDDIFAAIGTPVVAVADGTLNRVGWQRLGGWRLWVRDAMRNQFYYAHLSGYSPLALHSKRVKAGDVIGFIGNTGDAFTTSPHLHFEIHPHQLLWLKYNGAVNPTRYLNVWQHLARPHATAPAHPPFPHGAVRAEAWFVWRQLLAARGLISHGPRTSERPHVPVPHADYAFPARRVAAAASGIHAVGRASALRPIGVLLGIIATAILFASALVVRLRRRPSS